MKLLIVTLDKSVLEWKSLPTKIARIKAALDETRNTKWEVVVEYRDLTPTVSNGRITHDWFDDFSYPLFRQGNHFVGLHMTKEQSKQFGLKKTLRGSNHRDDDFVGEFYFWADEFSKRNGLNQFIQTCLHECSHEIANTTGVPDKTHQHHNAVPDISSIFQSYDMSRWQPKYQIGLKKISILEQIIALLTNNQKINFFSTEFPVSQAYGVKNTAFYPQTKHHIGVDYATPIGTPIIAPWDCVVTAVGSDKTLGFYAEVKHGKHYYYFLHLQSLPITGVRKKGWVIGFTGDTGFVTGPHCHIEKWNKKRNISLLTEDNFRQFTSDPSTV